MEREFLEALEEGDNTDNTYRAWAHTTVCPLRHNDELYYVRIESRTEQMDRRRVVIKITSTMMLNE